MDYTEVFGNEANEKLHQKIYLEKQTFQKYLEFYEYQNRFE